MKAVRAWLYDTWGFLALANGADPDHAAAEEADRWREARRVAVVTTDYVLDETLTALHRAAGAKVAVRFLDLLQARIEAGNVLLVGIDSARRASAADLFRKLAPKASGLSFTDCTSFAVMEELSIPIAFTADRHFHRPGRGIRPLFPFRKGRAVWSPPE